MNLGFGSCLFTVSLVLTVASPAEACSELLPQEFDARSCTGIRLVVPAGSFPSNATDSFVVIPYFNSGITQSDVELSEQQWATLELLRRDGNDELQSVDFDFVPDENLAGSARRVRLAEHQPGTYAIAWPEQTCFPGADGAPHSSFAMTEPVAEPSRLGQLRFIDSRINSQSFSRGTSASCEELSTTGVLWTTTVGLELDPSMEPWVDVASTSVLVDGQTFEGFSKLSLRETDAAGVVRFDLQQVCSFEDGMEPTQRLADGIRTVSVEARIAGQQLSSTSVSFEVDCAGATAPGCDVAAMGFRGGPSWLLLSGLWLLAWRRQHARLSRRC